jgi:hypothetical protein
MVQDSISEIKIRDGVEKLAAKKRRVRKNLFPCSEASSSEPSHQLQQEKCQKLVNSATNKSYDSAVSDTFRTMPSVSQTGRITARDLKTKAPFSSQSHKVDDVIRIVKNVDKGGVIIDAINLEMEKDESPESVTQNVEVCDGKVQAGKPSSQNFVDVSEKPKQTHGQETVPGLACIASYKKSHKIMNKHVGIKKSDTRENVKQATGFSVLTPHSSQVCKTHMVIKSQSITATNCPSGSRSNTDCKAPSRCASQRQKNKSLRQSPVNVETETDVICISDNSDDEIEWLCSKYNPKLDYELDREKEALKKEGRSAIKTGGNLTPKQTHISPKSDPYVQRNIPTCGMGAAASTGNSVSTLPNQVRTLITNPNNNTTYLTHTSTILHDKVEEEFPVMHNHVRTHTVQENQDSVSEARSTVQPSGSSYSVSGNSVLQTGSIERVQSHIPGQSTAQTALSSIPYYSTQNNQNVPVRTQDTLTPKQTHNAPNSNPYVQRMVPTSEMEAAASIGRSVNTLPNQSQTLVTNPNNNTTYLTRTSTILHDKAEEEFPVMHNHVGTHTVQENQDSVSEALSTVQPSGSSYSVSGNSVLQTGSIEHVQRHIPRPSTANTISSPLPLSSPQNNPNTPVHYSVAAGETITSVQPSSSMSNGPVRNLHINVGSQTVPSHVPGSQGSNVNPYIFILGSSPVTSVIQVTTDTTNRPPHAPTQDISSDAQLVTTNSPGFNSSTSSRILYPQLTQTTVPTLQLVDPLVDRARNCHLSVYQTNDNLPVAVRSSHLPSVHTSNPGFSSTPTEHPHTPITHTQHPPSLLANTRVLGSHQFSHTPEGQTRIPRTPLTKTRNSVTTEVQTRSPGTPLAYTSSAMLGKMSPGTPVARTSSAMLRKMSPGTPVAHTSSRSSVLHKTRSPSTSVARTHNSGTFLRKTRIPSKIRFSQVSSSGFPFVQTRNSGSSFFQAQTPATHVNPGTRPPQGRGHPSSIPETAKLIVVTDGNGGGTFALHFSSGAKVILTPEQVADIRAQNGGSLIPNSGM